MPSSIQLSPYALQMKDRDTGEFVAVDSFLGHDLLDTFAEYLDARTTEAREDEERQQLLRCSRYGRADRIVSGVIDAGEYGFEAELYSVTKRATAYHRLPTDAELIPFYFLLSVPAGEARAILILERFRQFGIRSTLWSDFLAYMENFRDDLVFQLEPLIPAGVVDAIRSSEEIKSVRFIKFSLPSDITDDLDPDRQLAEDDGVLELAVKAKRGSHLPMVDRFLSWLRGNQPLGEVIQIQGVEFDQVKLEVDVAGRTRTVDIGDFGRVRGQVDITDEIELDASGHPTFDSIDSVARGFLDDMHRQLGIS